ncbi:hypothetical protein KC953_01430 [Candidatus Saccharibacteria bacterium]|nr:hypothetical protein [Candidatus Saccharibacteria bacterium]
MINLLPDEVKHDIRAARMNVVLLRYNVMAVLSMVVLGVFCLTFYLLLQSSQSQAYTDTDKNNSVAAKYSDIRKEAEIYKNNLTIAKSIFSNVTNYTEIIKKITTLVPSGVVFDSLNLSDSTFGQQSSFSVHATSYEAALRLKDNFQNSGFFTNVSFQNLSKTSDDKYGVSVVISAKLNKVGI